MSAVGAAHRSLSILNTVFSTKTQMHISTSSIIGFTDELKDSTYYFQVRDEISAFQECTQ